MFFFRFAFLLFLFSRCSAVQSFGPLNVCCPNASALVGARFKLLSAGAGSKHGDLCNEQIRDSNERSHLSCGLFTQAPLKRGSVAAKKFICGLGVQFSDLPAYSQKVSSLLLGAVHNQTEFFRGGLPGG